MITKYKVNKNELVLDIKFLYDVGFQENNLEDIYEYTNRALTLKNIKFKGKKILLYVNGILLGTFFLTNCYLKKFNKKRNNYLLNDINSYFQKALIYEL